MALRVGEVLDTAAVQGVATATVERVVGATAAGGVVVLARVVGGAAVVVAWQFRHRPRLASRASATATRNYFVLRGQPRFAKANTAYVATERLLWDDSRPGGGILGPFTEALRLTRHGATPSVWDLPVALHPFRTAARLTYNSGLSSWSIEGTERYCEPLESAQEFVVETNGGIDRWIKEVIALAAPTPG